MELRINYVSTEGWVTDEFLMRQFIRLNKLQKEYELFKGAIVEKSELVRWGN